MNDSASRRNQGHRGLFAPVLLASVLWLAPGARAQNPPPARGPIPIYLPPDPPPLGLARAAADASPAPAWPAPAGLAPFVYDTFYAPLSTRLAKSEVGDDLQFRLEAYQSSKTALLTELRAKLATILKEGDPSARQQDLEAFGREQTPRIAELEAAAEQIRLDLCHSRSVQREYLRWQIDFAFEAAQDEGELANRFREVVRMDTYFHEGLSPAQRRLLRGIALEGAQGGGWFLFSPEPVLVHLPSNLPPDLAVKIAAYGREKSALESELLAALHPTRKTPADPSHVRAVRTLAAAQASRLADLETQAEDIRRGLARVQDPAHAPDLPPIPPELAARIAAHRRDTLALQKELLATVDAVHRASPPGDPGLGEKISAAITAFTEKNAARYADLEKSKDAIHADLARLPAAGGGGAAGTAADALQQNFSASLRQLQSYWDYRDYQTAVFQPGLSPEQRRLLFDGALEKLALPLPGAEFDPGRP